MAYTNSSGSFGSVSKLLHWAGAVLIFAMIALGGWAVKYPLNTAEEIAAKWELFALHKTVGVLAFGFGVLRLIWMAVSPRVMPLAPHGAFEQFLARLVHWLLTYLMVLVPLAGWVRHASLPGFAPLKLPFGDSLPFVPADPYLSEQASYVHFGFVVLLVVSVALHMVGALKHHFVDRDATLRRMLPGLAQEAALSRYHPRGAHFVAIALIACVLVAAVFLTPVP